MTPTPPPRWLARLTLAATIPATLLSALAAWTIAADAPLTAALSAAGAVMALALAVRVLVLERRQLR